MVDLVVLQSVSYVAAAIGVCVAAIYYVMMVRINQRTLRINMTNNLLQFQTSVEGQKVWMELINMSWVDYDDFERKYGSDYNLDNFAKRQAMWNQFEIMGNQLKAGILDRETIYKVTRIGPAWTWAKFKPIIEENRKRYAGKDAWTGFEYLAGEMLKMKLERDPTYKVPETFAKYVANK